MPWSSSLTSRKCVNDRASAPDPSHVPLYVVGVLSSDTSPPVSGAEVSPVASPGASLAAPSPPHAVTTATTRTGPRMGAAYSRAPATLSNRFFVTRKTRSGTLRSGAASVRRADLGSSFEHAHDPWHLRQLAH